ncbi:MAG: DUF2239 family protein, partial [Ferruginibacter sp.]|nr:DUF2239 family protein [Rhodoferax sp.]
MAWLDTLCTAFEGDRCIAAGVLRDVAICAKAAADLAADSPAPRPLLVFADASSETMELDWRGTLGVFTARLERQAQALDAVAEPDTPVPNAPSTDFDVPRGPGRPKLGVVAREVTLLPRHWEWLATQPGGASVALRKLVELAQRQSHTKDRV